MSKHTPGPWKTKDMVTGWIVGPGTIDGPSYVADVHRHTDGMTDAEAEANAALVSAAPEMLAALEAMLRAHEDGTFGVDGEQGRTLARDAVAKARGDATHKPTPRHADGCHLGGILWPHECDCREGEP